MDDARVLMVSLDQGLLGIKRSGDVVERHAGYGGAVERLDILVFAPGDHSFQVAGNVMAYSTNSRRAVGDILQGYRIGSRLFERNHYDLIVTQDPMITGVLGWLLKYKHGAKLLVHLHGDFLGGGAWYTRTRRDRLRGKLARIIVKRADGVRIMSENQRAALERAGVPRRRTRVISTPVDIGRFRRPDGAAALPEEIDRCPWKHTILMVARKDPVKDFATLFRAVSIVFDRCPDAGLWLVGNYDHHKEVPLPSERVVLTPSLASEHMPACYRLADVVVLTSRSESFGKVLVEANASGKAIVATETAGAGEIINDGWNGYLVGIGDFAALAERILLLLANPELASRLGRNGQKSMQERYANNTMKVVTFWKDIIEGNLS